MKSAYQTLVVNLPMRENTITCQENPPTRVAPHFQEPKIPRQKTRVNLSQESELCYVKMRGNVLYLYHPNDL
jgi:hypothetical protein